MSEAQKHLIEVYKDFCDSDLMEEADYIWSHISTNNIDALPTSYLCTHVEWLKEEGKRPVRTEYLQGVIEGRREEATAINQKIDDLEATIGKERPKVPEALDENDELKMNPIMEDMSNQGIAREYKEPEKSMMFHMDEAGDIPDKVIMEHLEPKKEEEEEFRGAYKKAFNDACKEYEFAIALALWEHIGHLGLAIIHTESLKRFIVYLITLEEVKYDDGYYSNDTKIIREELDKREQEEL